MYVDHYGFTGQPFQLTPDARFWFESRTHRKAMAYLGFGLTQGEGFIVVTGEIGAGKSTLVAHLMANIDRARLNALSFVSTQVEGDDMLRLVAQGFGIATGGTEKARLLDAVERRLEEELRAGKRNLLIVDEAQNLPVSALEELRMLSNFQLGGRALIQIVLLGQPEFRDKLASPGLEQLRQRVIASHHLDAMDEDELEQYLGHRLGVVGWQGRPDFAPEALNEIQALTGGIPRRVNQLANRLLLQAALEGEDLITGESVRNVAAELLADQAGGRTAATAPAEPVAAPVTERRREGRDERVLPFRSSANAHVASPPADPAASALWTKAAAELADRLAALESRPAADASIEQRIAALEARSEAQERMLRRVLTLLVDWVENPETAFRNTHAA